jgi:hypothetical protein
MMQLRTVLPDVFQQQGHFQQLGTFQQWLPRCQTDFEKAAPIPVMSGIITGVADHLDRVENRHQVEDLLKPGARYLTYERVGAAGAKVPEWPMQRDADIRLAQLLRQVAGFRASQCVQLRSPDADFEIEAMLEDQVQVAGEILPGHADMHHPDHAAQLGMAAMSHTESMWLKKHAEFVNKVGLMALVPAPTVKHRRCLRSVAIRHKA